MADAETAAAPLGYLRFDDYCIRESRWRFERGAQVNHRNAHNLIGLQHLPFGQASLLEQCRRACVEVGQVARVMDNLSGIAVAPLDVNCLPVGYVRLFAHQ